MSITHIRKDRIVEYLEDIESQVADIERLEVPSAAFLSDQANFERIKAIKFSLACAIQDVTRIALHISTALGLASVRESESESIEALVTSNVLPKDFAVKIIGMPAFRNRLIHDYLPDEFSGERLWQNLQRLNDFHEFARLITTWLQSLP